MCIMKKTVIMFIGCIASLGIISNAYASLLAYEGFDYASTNLAGANGGSGWATSWKGNAALTTNSLADMQTNSVPAPTGYGPNPIGGSTKMANPGGAISAYRGLTSASDIDLGVTSTYYMSMLVERSGSGFSFGIKDSSGVNNVLGAAVSTGGAITMSVGTNAVTSANIIGNGSAYLWVFKVVANASGVDTAYVQVYNEGVTVPSAEPAAWLLTNNVALSSIGSVLYLGGGSNRTIQYDEIRIGTTWDSVVIPEPATIGLLGLALPVLLCLRRAFRS